MTSNRPHERPHQRLAPLPPDELAERLKRELPDWRVADGAIERQIATSGWRATLMVVNAIGHLAEAAWHHPSLSVDYARVSVSLWTHDANGITERDLALAKKIDEVVMWRPGQEAGSVLEGPPEGDPRQAYVLHGAATGR